MNVDPLGLDVSKGPFVESPALKPAGPGGCNSDGDPKLGVEQESKDTSTIFLPRQSRYLIKELGLKDHEYYGFWGPKD